MSDQKTQTDERSRASVLPNVVKKARCFIGCKMNSICRRKAKLNQIMSLGLLLIVKGGRGRTICSGRLAKGQKALL